MVYHMIMARKEVLVQLDDDMVRRLDTLAERLGSNRSELLRRGATTVLETEEAIANDARLVDAYRRRPQEPSLVETARRQAAETTPSW